MNNYISIKEQARIYGVHVCTIRRWCRAGTMACHHRTIGQHRRFEVATIKNNANTIGYVRVSTHGQKDDLKVQENSLREKSTLMGISLDNVISDVGSGINCRKKGLKILISKVLAGNIKHIVLMHKDRLIRFGYEIIEQICQAMHVKITILEESPFKTKEQILCGNLIEILTVYCSAFYGMRSHSNKPKTQNAQVCTLIPSTV